MPSTTPRRALPASSVPASEATPRLDTEALKASYKRFVSFGRTHKQAYSSTIEFDEGLDGRQFKKLCQDSKLLGGYFRAPDADILFAKVKLGGENTIRFDEFLEALATISSKKGVPLHMIAGKVSKSVPKTNNAAIPREVRLHDDKVNAYTGTQGQKAQAVYNGPALLSPIIQKRFRSKLAAGLERIRRDAAQGPEPLLKRTVSDMQHSRTRTFEPVVTAAADHISEVAAAAMAQEKAHGATRAPPQPRSRQSSGDGLGAGKLRGPRLRRRSESTSSEAPHTWNPSPKASESEGAATEAEAFPSERSASSAPRITRSRSESDAQRRRSGRVGVFDARMLLPIFEAEETPKGTKAGPQAWVPPLPAVTEDAEVPVHLQAAMGSLMGPSSTMDKAPVNPLSPSSKQGSGWGSDRQRGTPRADSVSSRRSTRSNISTHTNYRDYEDTGQLRPALSRESLMAWAENQPKRPAVEPTQIARQVSKAELAVEIVQSPAVATKLRNMQETRHPALYACITTEQEDACLGRFQAYFISRAFSKGTGREPADEGDDARQAALLKQCLASFVDEEAAMQTVFNCYCMYGLWRAGVDAHTSRELKLSLQSFSSLCRDCGLLALVNFSLTAAQGTFNLLKSKGSSSLTFRQFMEVLGSVSDHLHIPLVVLRERVAKPKTSEMRPVAAPPVEAELVQSWLQGSRRLGIAGRSSARSHRKGPYHHSRPMGLVS